LEEARFDFELDDATNTFPFTKLSNCPFAAHYFLTFQTAIATGEGLMREVTNKVTGATAFLFVLSGVQAFTVSSPAFPISSIGQSKNSILYSAPADTIEEAVDYEQPEDAVIYIKPKAMKRLRELREKEKKDSLVLRMGVRNGGCSGLSYVMDFSKEEEIQEDDAVDEYPADNIKCVVDAKSMLYLYGLELDYSEELIGGGFKFFNPNAEEACGCGSSFGV
jgi:iron-sulfur cluster assembly protein